ncbi:hypothetical protein KC367_g3344 [Hortaea werneckii]|uniref:Methyltransferase domain-containing protein n=2 Tax=Hortaea werneckii TaxID=91943 RepID=A0A3M7IUG4_HORWE|nr:hypothetical protein KC342_g6354 [Hortaea werneckii]OTA34062.1 hypothetical protein BTJ68_05870 [Hortaea werneckii EXF-2000]KAI6840161.1 hypothetical protein KC350_g5493 [Hortaea werneckii]KAI6846530.1 hypothetical protein KC358_g2784 [Hortaea werneckii]KAI6941674.1 hypothetical protein KC341_g2701 [Hortaea werneckii]
MDPHQEQDTYTGLSRDQEESQRLNLQHDLYVRSTGFHIHPRIVATLPSDAHIAEVATGTGIWLRSLAASPQSCPGWKYTGFDLSAEQFPSEPERKGVNFRVLDILKPPPEEERGKYDVVHVRLLVCGLKGSDWQHAARNMLALLKPGGWIQWHEGAFAELQFMQSSPSAPYPSASRELARYAVRTLNGEENKVLTADVVELPQTVAEAGFADVERYLFSSDRAEVEETRKLATQVEIGALIALARYCARVHSDAGKGESEVEGLVERCQEEMKAGQWYCRWDMHVVTGRKAGG